MAVSYTAIMSTTLSIRADEQLLDALRKRASAQGKTVSEVVREILEEKLVERPLATRAGHLRGRLDSDSAASDPWRQQLRERNWRS
jgi:predicted transcriptional regulator